MTLYPAGTIFQFPGMITSNDPSSYVDLTDAGQGRRVMFDRRTDAFETYDAYLFDVRFADGRTVEFQVNPEFGSVEAARALALEYALPIGRLPTALRRDVETVWIHDGVEPWGGGNNNLLIHHGQGALYAADGIVEETLVHEAVHTSLDARYGNATPAWVDAQNADDLFPSPYARDNAAREDMAESFLLHLAIREYPERLGVDEVARIEADIPNRIAYFDSLNLELGSGAVVVDGWTTGDDRQVDESGSDTIDGLAGVDTVVYAVDRADMTESVAQDGTVTVTLGNGDVDTLRNIERIELNDGIYIYDIRDEAQETYRLYSASLARTPDEGGLRFWDDARERGLGFDDLSQAFVDSIEFNTLFGGAAPSSEVYIDALYTNTLGRVADQEGRDFWIDSFDRGVSRAGMLQSFSESDENKANNAENYDDGFFVV